MALYLSDPPGTNHTQLICGDNLKSAKRGGEQTTIIQRSVVSGTVIYSIVPGLSRTMKVPGGGIRRKQMVGGSMCRAIFPRDFSPGSCGPGLWTDSPFRN